jgi:hypothetical protein
LRRGLLFTGQQKSRLPVRQAAPSNPKKPNENFFIGNTKIHNVFGKTAHFTTRGNEKNPFKHYF